MANGIYITKHGKSEESFELRPIDLGKPESGQVKITVSTFGLNYADVMARTGLYNDAPPPPFVPGYEVVGVIKEIGNNVTDLKVGDRVVALTRFGAYAEEAMADQRAVCKLPNSVSDEIGTALATQYCTAYYNAIYVANIQKGENVLVHAAAGGVGIATVQLAKWRECTVFGTASRPEKLDFLKEIGCDYPINYRENDYVSVISQRVGEKPIDVIFNPIGGKSFKKDQKLLALGGRHVLYGVSTWSGSKGGLLDKLKLAWDFGLMHPLGLLIKSQGVIGVNMLRIADNKPHIIGECLQACIDLYEQEVLKPHIGGVFSTSQIHEAHNLLEGRSSMGKIVVKW